MRRRRYLVLKGEMVHLEQEERIMFCGLPHVRSLAEMRESNVCVYFRAASERLAGISK